MDNDFSIVYVWTDNIYKEITKDVEKRFNASNYELQRPLLKQSNKKAIGLMKEKSLKKSKMNSLDEE